MAKGHKPKAGSRAFWPRKRARRIYPRLKVCTQSIGIMDKMKESKPIAFAAYKAGMTHVMFTDTRKGSVTEGHEISRPVTVLDCPPLVVFGIKLYKKELGRYKDIGTLLADSLKKELSRKLLIFDRKKKHDAVAFEKLVDGAVNVRLVVHTQPKESGLGKKKPEVFELDIGGATPRQKWEYAKHKLGKEIDIAEVFAGGEYVDVSAVDIGKGYQGPVKRFGIVIRSRKNKGKRRHVGTMGPVTPARVLPGRIPLAGQMGFQTRTEYNKRIIKVGSGGISPDGGFINYGVVPKAYIMLEGSVPGPKKRLIMFRKSFRKTTVREPVEISHVSVRTQQ
jgi:large subunit ribosomal protein L3